MALLWVGGTLSRPALADDAATASVAKLNKAALDAFDELNFDQAKTLLEQALTQSQGAGRAGDPATARTHLNLGMILIAGFQQREAAIEHFKAALKIQPDIAPPPGLFNPEVQAVFDEVKAAQQADRNAVRSTQRTAPPSAAAAAQPVPPSATADQRAGDANAAPDESTDEEENDDQEEPVANTGSKYFLAAGLGSGMGLAKGQLDANRDLDSDGDGRFDNNWSGGVAPSRLGHLTLGGGYFVSRDLLVSLYGRLQIISGTTTVKGDPMGPFCVPSCTAPSTAIAIFAKADWFLTPGPLRPFVTGGIGGGSIRQVVELNVARGTAGTPALTGCGASGNETCVDTVTGGPFWMAVGGGLAYEIGSCTLLGSLTANVGIPKVMLNIDALFGVGLRL